MEFDEACLEWVSYLPGTTTKETKLKRTAKYRDLLYARIGAQ